MPRQPRPKATHLPSSYSLPEASRGPKPLTFRRPAPPHTHLGVGRFQGQELVSWVTVRWYGQAALPESYCRLVCFPLQLVRIPVQGTASLFDAGLPVPLQTLVAKP